MTYQDDRTDDQRRTHQYAVTAKDKFMSGWGGAAGGASWCAWACETMTQARTVADWVRGRKEMRYVKIHYLPRYRVARGTAHFHVYVVDPNVHPAFR